MGSLISRQDGEDEEGCEDSILNGNVLMVDRDPKTPRSPVIQENQTLPQFREQVWPVHGLDAEG